MNTGFESGGAIGGSRAGEVSPASDYRRRSMSPGMPTEARYVAGLGAGTSFLLFQIGATLGDRV